MSKEIELARTAAGGAIHLFVGKIVSRIIGGLGGLLLIRLLGPPGYGLLSVAVVAPGIFELFSDFGVNAALTKYLAEHRSKGEVENLKTLLYSGLAFRIALSFGLTILCYITADAFSTSIGRPYVAPLIRLASLLVLAWTLYGFSGAVFLGLDATRAYAALMCLYELLRVSLPIILVIYGMEVFGALFGTAVATLIAGFIGILASILITVKMAGGSAKTFGLGATLKKILGYGVPLATAGLISSAVGQYYGFMIAAYCIDLEIGNYNAAVKAVAAITYLTFPISSVLFPAFSKINPEKELAVLKKIFTYSAKYSSFLILPAVALILILARPLTILLFGIEFENAWIYLALLTVGQLSYGLGESHLKGLLMAQGETTVVAKLEVLSAVIGISLGLVLIPSYGILGLILTVLVAGWPSYFVAMKKVYKKYRVKPPLRDVWKLYVSLAIMTLVVMPMAIAPINEALKVVMCSMVGFITFVIVALITRAIKEGDINALTSLMKPLPLIGVIADKILKIMEQIVKLRTQRKIT